MKQTVDQKIETILDIAPAIIPQKDVTVIENTTIDDDYEYARKNLRSLIDNGKDVMNNLTFLAKEGESPRAYEVLGQLIKTLAETNKDLLDIAKKKKDIQQEKNGEQPTHVTNALFVGSTAELQKLILSNK
jgi:flagellar biosynthesis chaperone FliJ